MQSQAGLSFAGQQQHRHGKRILAVLLMLVMAVTGAWADIDTHWPDFNRLSYDGNSDLVAGITIDGVVIDCTYVGWDQLEVAAFVDNECRSAGESVNYLYNGYVVEYGDPFPVLDGMNLYFNGEGGETVTFKMYNHATGVEYTTYTLTLNGEAISILTGEAHQEGWDDPENPIFLNFTSSASPAASDTYNVAMQVGTEDGTSWTAKAGTGQYQQLPLRGVAEGTQVSLKYSGKKRVKSFKTTAITLKTPLTMEAISDGTINVNSPKSGMKYSKNGAAKTSEGIATISVKKGDRVAFYGNGTSITSYKGTKFVGGSANVIVYGNIMSLVDEDNFATAKVLTETEAFSSLFNGNAALTDASCLLLPATTLTASCYNNMLKGCSNLTTAPAKLPATTLANKCYYGMFQACTSLTAAPELPATSLAEECYHSMFRGCSALTAAPELKAEKMASTCYGYMFFGCKKLTTAPELKSTKLAEGCYSCMFYNCDSLTAAPALDATTLPRYCYSNMFRGCKSLTVAPALDATVLSNYCYRFMFYDCISLTAAPELKATTLAEGCYQSMFHGCTNLSAVTCLATDIAATKCTDSWLYGVAATGTFTTPSTTAWTEKSSSGIPSGWTRVDYVEE